MNGKLKQQLTRTIPSKAIDRHPASAPVDEMGGREMNFQGCCLLFVLVLSKELNPQNPTPVRCLLWRHLLAW